jgi:hypothetical protein
MASPSADRPTLYFDPTNTARQTRARFRFQDECVALRCAENLALPELRAVVVEWCSDYLTVAADGSVELVSIKHREPDQRSWSASDLGKPVADLHRYWRAMGQRCECVFASNLGIPDEAMKRLPGQMAPHAGIPLADARRFLDETFSQAVLPHRQHITAVAVETMRGALILLDRDPAYADACYVGLVDRIRQASTEEPPTAAQKATRLAGSMNAVIARHRPDQDAQTLTLADLRALVLTIHDDCAMEPPRPALPRPAAGTRTTTDRQWGPGEHVHLGAGTYLVHEPIHVTEAPDGGYLFVAAPARQLAPAGRDVWLRSIHPRRDSSAASARRAALVREAALMRDLAMNSGAPTLLDLAEDAGAATVIIARTGRALPEAYGPLGVAYPALAVDALLRGLPGLGRVLGALHARGYAHRDLGPESLQVTGQRGELALRDLGLATVAPAPGEGPPGYRAPEQDRPLLCPPGPPTDVYQLAAVVYHALTGNLAGAEPVPPSLLRPSLSSAVDEVLLPALHVESDRRPPVRQLCGALGRLVGAAVVISA